MQWARPSGLGSCGVDPVGRNAGPQPMPLTKEGLDTHVHTRWIATPLALARPDGATRRTGGNAIGHPRLRVKKATRSETFGGGSGHSVPLVAVSRQTSMPSPPTPETGGVERIRHTGAAGLGLPPLLAPRQREAGVGGGEEADPALGGGAVAGAAGGPAAPHRQARCTGTEGERVRR